MDKISVNKERLLSEIKRIHQSSFYKYRKTPKLIAVSKQQENEKILEALKNGQKIFGENRVQEAEKKWTNHLNINKDIELHLIGPLQSNKVKKALNIFDVIHTFDMPVLEDWKSLSALEVCPPAVTCYWVRPTESGIASMFDESGMSPGDFADEEAIHSEYVYRNTHKLNVEFYAQEDVPMPSY